MSELDLDAIEAQARHWDHLIRDDPDTTLALVAEVQRLRARFRLCRDCESTLAKCELAADVGAVKCCPDCRHDGP
jgi:hypothetical protein